MVIGDDNELKGIETGLPNIGCNSFFGGLVKAGWRLVWSYLRLIFDILLILILLVFYWWLYANEFSGNENDRITFSKNSKKNEKGKKSLLYSMLQTYLDIFTYITTH